MRNIVLGILFIVLVGAFFLIGKSDLNKPPEKEIHFHAGFMVYQDGVKQDFSDIKYMDIEPCNDKQGTKELEENQQEKAHLHDNIGDVVHVHREGAVWGDILANIKFQISPPMADPPLAENIKKLKGYVNGAETTDILNYPIKPYDSALFVFGNTENVDVKQIVGKDHIIEVENKSETCGGE